MACEKFEDQIMNYFEGALSEQERRSVNRHVAGCPECHLFFEQQSRLEETLAGGLTPPAASPYFRQRILRQLVRESQPARVPYWPELLDLLGAAAVAVAGGLLLGRLTADLPALPPKAGVVMTWAAAGVCWLAGFGLAIREGSRRFGIK